MTDVRPDSWSASEELVLLREQVGRFLQKEFAPHSDRWNRERLVDRDAWRKAGEAGLLLASVPEEYGGSGGTLAHEAVIIEEIYRAGLAGNFGAGHGVHSAVVAHYVLSYANETQKRRWLPEMAAGITIGAVAMTEPGTGSDLQRIRTMAKRVDGGYLISGQKTFISNGQNAELVVVAAKTDASGSGNSISLFAVEVPTNGFRRGRNLDKIGMHGQDTSELFFDEVFVPAQNLLGGEEGRGFSQLKTQLAWERMSCALSAVVNMERAVDLTVEYTRQRQAFGQPIFAFQNTQFKLAECKTQATVARAFIDTLMSDLLANRLDATAAAMAKWWTTDAQCKLIDECVQLHGGYGYMAEYPIAQLWADTRVSRIYAGANEIMKMLIARAL